MTLVGRLTICIPAHTSDTSYTSEYNVERVKLLNHTGPGIIKIVRGKVTLNKNNYGTNYHEA